MGRAPCCEKEGLRRGAWSADEDQRLVAYIQENGHPNWRALPRQAGLLRCGKSCRLRWINYLRPDIKRGNFTADEEALIVRLHRELGNRWSAIAAQLPGRTDNEIKNVWHTHIKKRLEDGGAGDGAGAGDEEGKKKKKARKSKPAAAAANAKRSASTAKKDADAADAVDNSEPYLTASPGLSSSVSSGVTFSAATDSSAAAVSSSADNNAATTSSHHQQEQQPQQQQVVIKAEEVMEMESFSSADELLLPPIDDSFWSSADVMDMGLGAMDEELGLGLAGPPSSSTRDEDMDEFWLKMLLEAGDGDMSDLSVL